MTLDLAAGALVAIASWPLVWAAVTSEGRKLRALTDSRRAMSRAFQGRCQ